MILDLAPGLVEAGALAFARVGALSMLLPGLGERSIPARQRLLLALALAVMALPAVRDGLASQPKSPILHQLVAEAAVGLAIGACGRLTLAAMETAGAIVAQSIGLSFAQVVDPGQGQQGEILSTFLRLTGVALIFAADLHHLAIAGVLASYAALPPGAGPPAGDIAELFVRLLGETFRAGVGIAAPFLVFGFVFNLGLGLAAKLTPQLQLFFLAIPLSVGLGLAALALALPGAARRFLDLAASILAAILPAM